MQRDRRIGFIGLGAMGAGMAGNLVRPAYRHRLRPPPGGDRRAGRGRRQAATSPAAAAKDAQLLFVMVVNDARSRTCCSGRRVRSRPYRRAPPSCCAARCRPPSSASGRAPRRARHPSARCAGQRWRYRRRGGTLTIMASGCAEALPRPRRARRLRQKGPPPGRPARHRLDGQGGQPAAGWGQPGDRRRGHGVRRGARRRPQGAVRGDQGAAGGSWMFDNRVPHMLDDDFTPQSAVDIWVKDLALVLDTGRSLRMPLPMAAAAFQVVMMAAARGLARSTTPPSSRSMRSSRGARSSQTTAAAARWDPR